MRSSSVLAVATLGAFASAYELPANLKKIYDQHKVYFIDWQLVRPYLQDQINSPEHVPRSSLALSAVVLATVVISQMPSF
jgi:hypothetical protein